MSSKYTQLAVILVLLIMSTGVASAVLKASQHPPGYGEICFPCHELLLSEGEQYSKLSHCKCHSVDIWKGEHVVMEKLSKLHGLDPCIKCHVGAGYSSGNLDAIAVHVPHTNVKCSACHGEGVVVKPESKNCYYCHKGGVHEVHYEILNEICVACHGKVIYKFAELKKEVGIKETPIAEKAKPFSLYDVLKNIFAGLLGRI